LAVEGAFVEEDKVVALGAADEGVVGVVEAGWQRPNRLRQALGIGLTVHERGLGYM